LRVVAGTAGRTTLVAPKGLNTRPTSDMAKENLFNILAPYIKGATVLDLFCGSGAIAIEALSRGAEFAVLADSAKAAILSARQNLEKTKLSHKAELLFMPVERACKNLAGQSFDLIFLDPPYETSLVVQTLEQIKQHNLLANEGIIVAETDVQFKNAIEHPQEFDLIDTRIYGRTCFLFYKMEAK